MSFRFTGVCVGGQNNGHVITCSKPYFEHLAADGRRYLKYKWARDLGVWTPEDQPFEVTMNKLSTAYQMLHGVDYVTLIAQARHNLVLYVTKYSQASIENTMQETGASRAEVMKARAVRDKD